MADRLDDLYIKLTTGTLQELLVWVTLCSNRAATRVNDLKAGEKCHEGNTRFCSAFGSARKL